MLTSNITSARLKHTRHLLALASAVLCMSAQAATITITSRDPAGVGFNDPTPVAPVGGNPGTTLGQQRMNVYRHVADIWEQALTSNVTITVNAGWEALTCDAGSAVLGSAGAWNIWHDFPGAVPGTWYPQALANKLAGVNLSDGNPDSTGYDNVDIKTQFNVNLGQANCLAGSTFYLGYDGNAGSNVNFVETLLHELGHGLGFSVMTVQTSTGYRVDPTGNYYVTSGGLPSIWEGFMYDNTAGKTWLTMSNAERKASAVNPLKLAWTGNNAVTGAAATLKPTSVLKITTPVPGVSGLYDYGAASFGPTIASPSSLGSLAVMSAANPLGCTAFSAADTAAVNGKVAIIDRGTCAFVIKVKNAQNAGAVGVLVADNVDAALSGLGGSDTSITIPSARITKANGTLLKAAVAQAPAYGTRSKAGTVAGAWAVDATRIAGADAVGRPLLYTPTVLAGGSSVSHWDVTATPNLLMEPFINSDLTTSLVPPKDLTLPLLKDIGW
ncbi:PA domain-containing protein [Roseateles koreensis]|uniref:Peptidase n=1 Tax=Roseateles koreensis TaxID=2987526 RepID=A0ABT5KS12_9BURK|nr:PA domain-containing protein [Roseateles koreensis]MDC8785711.1 peptidase [Roseateles koreensis]